MSECQNSEKIPFEITYKCPRCSGILKSAGIGFECDKCQGHSFSESYLNEQNCKIPQFDPVNHPKHYNSGEARCECGRRIQCIDIARFWGFNLGNVLKYLWRHEHKDGIEALKKARWYLDDEIKKREKNV